MGDLVLQHDRDAGLSIDGIDIDEPHVGSDLPRVRANDFIEDQPRACRIIGTDQRQVLCQAQQSVDDERSEAIAFVEVQEELSLLAGPSGASSSVGGSNSAGGRGRSARRLIRVVAAWIAQLARGILALALGLIITLTLDHSPVFGLVTFGAFAVLTGVVLIGATLFGAYAGRMRAGFLVQGVATLAAGIMALAAPGGGVAFLAILVGAWALLAGLLEGASGILARRRSDLARDWIIGGALTVSLGAVALLLPPDFEQALVGEKGATGTLTTSVILIGVIGAWAILVGVLQTISAITVRSVRGGNRAESVVGS